MKGDDLRKILRNTDRAILPPPRSRDALGMDTESHRRHTEELRSAAEALVVPTGGRTRAHTTLFMGQSDFDAESKFPANISPNQTGPQIADRKSYPQPVPSSEPSCSSNRQLNLPAERSCLLCRGSCFGVFCFAAKGG